MAKQPKDGPLPWLTSKAKSDLLSDLKAPNSTIVHMTARQIYESDTKYSCYKWENFKSNLKRMCKTNGITLPEEVRARKGKSMSKKYSEFVFLLTLTLLTQCSI